MKIRVVAVLALAAVGFVLAPTCARATPAGLTAFRSDDELKAFLKKIAKVRADVSAKAGPVPPPPPPVAMAEAAAAPSAGAPAAVGAGGSITNNQIAGVDEGDIVKSSGNFLIVLRRGRLFTLSLADGGLKPVDAIDAFAPGINPRGDWYDEMLVAGDRIVIVGYSYSRGGTQVNRFRLGRDGHLSFEDAYALKSNDYYSSRNYASRLIGTKLIFYSPHYLPWFGPGDDVAPVFPALRRWTADVDKGAFKPIGTVRDIYLSPGQDPDAVSAVHTVTSCDLAQAVLNCTATSVLGPDGRVFFVSNSAVYVWVNNRYGRAAHTPSAMVYRLPLDGGRPQAVRAHGAPVDQFSFRESGRAIDVLVRADSAGEAMWAAERSRGDVGMVHIPLSAFADGTSEIPRWFYRDLPEPKGSYYDFHNRFVGDFLLYGEGNGWGAPKGYVGAVIVAPLKGGAPVELALPHGVDRIEAMGRDAVVVGSDGKNVVFSAVALKQGVAPSLGDRYVLAGASQAETRSHGFFFKPDANPRSGGYEGDFGVLGLPVMRPSEPAFHQLFREAAAVVFVRRVDGKFALLGEVPSHPGDARDDGCKASCIDWYGNARPIFYGGRTFALMGYEIVEAVLGQKDMSEKARVNFAVNVPRPMSN